jgi:hypothetical protein
MLPRLPSTLPKRTETKDRPDRWAASRNDQLGDTLGRPHDIERLDRLIGRDQHQTFRAASQGGVDDGLRPEHVVAYRFLDINFHQGNVLVGGGMEDHIGPESVENALDARLISDVGDHRMHRQVAVVLFQLEQGLEDAVFAMTEQRQLGRPPARDLAAQLEADRPARPGHQNALPGQASTDGLVVDGGRLAATQSLISTSRKRLTLTLPPNNS